MFDHKIMFTNIHVKLWGFKFQQNVLFKNVTVSHLFCLSGDKYVNTHQSLHSAHVLLSDLQLVRHDMQVYGTDGGLTGEYFVNYGLVFLPSFSVQGI